MISTCRAVLMAILGFAVLACEDAGKNVGATATQNIEDGAKAAGKAMEESSKQLKEGLVRTSQNMVAALERICRPVDPYSQSSSTTIRRSSSQSRSTVCGRLGALEHSKSVTRRVGAIPYALAS